MATSTRGAREGGAALATSSLAFLEAWFDRELDHEVVAYVAHEPRRSAGDQLEALCADFRDWVASRPRLPGPGRDWLRPYLPTRLWHDNRQAVAGYPIRGDWYENPDQAATDALNAIAHGLLYRDSIAIGDHLVLVLELDLLNQVADDAGFARARRFAAEILAFYRRISDLIHAGIVALVQPDTELHNVIGSLDYGDSLWDLAKDGDGDLFGPDVSTLDDRFGRLVVGGKLLVSGKGWSPPTTATRCCTSPTK